MTNYKVITIVIAVSVVAISGCMLFADNYRTEELVLENHTKDILDLPKPFLSTSRSMVDSIEDQNEAYHLNYSHNRFGV